MLTSTVRQTYRTGWSLAAVLFLFFVAGCSGKVANVHHAEDYDPLAQEGVKYAVGGFVLGAQADLDEQEELGTVTENGDPRLQTDAWAHVLYGPLLAGNAGQSVWAWSALRDNIPRDTITVVQAAYAKGSALPPEMFSPIAQDLPEINYLVLARLEKNEIGIGEIAPASPYNSVFDDTNEAHANSNTLLNTVKTRRTVVVTMDIYDLRSGRSVWSGTVERKKTELFGPDTVDQGEDLVITPATEEGEPPEIRIKGASVEMPALTDLLTDACVALVENLFAVPE